MAIFKSSNSGIPFGNTAGRPSSPGTGQPYFNGELQRLELYTGATYGWQNIVAETPGVTGYTGNVIETNTTNTITITGTNFSSGATASLIGTDGTEYVATTTIVSNLTSITATFGTISASIEPYDIKITNPSNLYGVYYDILTVNDKPVWTTAAGSLGNIITGQVISNQLSATDEENNSLTYSLASGSLPTGLSLSSSGLISGTASGATSQTFNFTISVSDGINTAQSRSFSYIYTAIPVITGGTLTSDATYYYRAFSANGTLTISNGTPTIDILAIGGGGAGGSDVGGGGGAGGAIYRSSSIASGTYSVVVGGGAAANGSDTMANKTGTNTTIDTLTAFGGGGGGYYYAGAGGTGGCGGGAAGQSDGSTQSGGSTNQTSNGSGTGYGFAGGSGSGGGSYNGAGGAGIGGASSNATGNSGTAGANGLSTWSSWGAATGYGHLVSTTYWFGGGGGGGSNTGYSSQPGGNGGGGVGRPRGSAIASNLVDGKANTGGGGGGSGAGGAGNGGNGGSGIVIIRYTKASVGG